MSIGYNSPGVGYNSPRTWYDGAATRVTGGGGGYDPNGFLPWADRLKKLPAKLSDPGLAQRRDVEIALVILRSRR